LTYQTVIPILRVIKLSFLSMNKFWLVAIVLCFAMVSSSAQLFPADGRKITYRLVPFRFPAKWSGQDVRLEIAVGSTKNEDTFGNHRFFSQTGKVCRLMAEAPQFGMDYTWRFSVPAKKYTSPFYHFSILPCIIADTTKSRLNVTTRTEKYQGDYVFVDGSKALYDMSGFPIWFMPDMPGQVSKNAVRDLKISGKQTITFLYDGEAYAIDYDGNILWKAPNGVRESKSDSIQTYHHELTRLANGHYMILSIEPIARPVKDSVSGKQRSRADVRRNNQPNRIKEIGTILEYDEAGKIVWQWDSRRYLDSIDSAMLRKPGVHPPGDAHENSFFFDQKDNSIYVSFRNLSQVIRISYPGGNVLDVYGNKTVYPDTYWDSLFCGQHSCSISSSGDVLLFDNGCDNTQPPKALVLRRPVGTRDSLQELWQFICPVKITNTVSNKSSVIPYTTGGNVLEMQVGDIFVSTCSPYNDMYIVDEGKNILWQAALQRRNTAAENWLPQISFKSSIITRQQLESLIWSSLPKD
jgi:Arylsulfotransferase (ASST)